MVGMAGATKGKLLAAAVQVLLDQGWSEATAREISTRAGVPLGSIHYHYGSTPALLRAAAMAGLESLFAAPAARAASATSPAELLELSTAWLTADSLGAAKARFLLETLLRAHIDPELGKQVAKALHDWRRGLALLLSAIPGQDMGAEQDALAAAIAAVAMGLLVHALADPSFPVAAASEAIVRLLPPP